MSYYEDIINENIKDVKKIEKISETSNIVFKVITDNENLYAKFYKNQSSHKVPAQN